MCLVGVVEGWGNTSGSVKVEVLGRVDGGGGRGGVVGGYADWAERGGGNGGGVENEGREDRCVTTGGELRGDCRGRSL